MTIDNNFMTLFKSLISRKESEVVEFKRAENSFDFDDLGKYFSALSNEANLRGLEFAWLIFGYDEKKHLVVGTSYKNGEGALNKLKHDFAQHTTDGQTFREIIPIDVDSKRVLMFKIPASPRNIVMKWKGIAYGRDGESLKPLNQSKRDEIRHQTPEPDWSAEIVPNATIDDLDEVAIAKAKMMFRKVHNRIPAEEVNRWSTEEQLTGYTKVKGLERDKIKQMILQYIQNAGIDGAKRDVVMEYLEGTLPGRNTDEQNTEVISNILRKMKDEKIIDLKGRL